MAPNGAFWRSKKKDSDFNRLVGPQAKAVRLQVRGRAQAKALRLQTGHETGHQTGRTDGRTDGRPNRTTFVEGSKAAFNKPIDKQLRNRPSFVEEQNSSGFVRFLAKRIAGKTISKQNRLEWDLRTTMTEVKRVAPGPKGRFISGSLPAFVKSRLDFLTDLAREYGDVSSFRIGPKRIFLLNHPDLIEQVLVTDAKHYIKHFGARVYKPVLGNGLVTSEGDYWLRQRRLCQPAFLPRRLAGYGPTMVAITRKMIAEDWREGLLTDIHFEMSRITSAIALKTLFDLDRGPEADDYTESLRDVFQRLSIRFRRLLHIPHWLPTPNNIRMRRSLRRLQSLVDGFIQQGRARKTPGDDLLSRLIDAQDEDGTRMTDEQLRDEAMTLYLAGHETTALTLSWAWYAIARHPQVEDNLVSEWSQVLAGREPTVEDLPRLVYTEHVITEAMRIYPPVYLVGREPLTDREVGGYLLRRGTTAFMSQWVTQRDPRFFDEPLEFRPERWADGLAKRLPKYAYFPFGGGPRVCIGNGFAMMEAVLLLATIGQQYRFTLEPEPQVTFDLGITLLPKDGIPAVLKRR